MSNYLKSGDFIGGAQFLNQVADTVASGQPDALGVLPGTSYGGGLTSGDYLRLTDAEALALSNTTVGTLFNGLYRRVFLASGITGGGNTGFKRGSLVFWDLLTANPADPYQVTNVEATDSGLIAGYIINASDTAGAPLSGKYVWIQVAGMASALFRGTVTSTTTLAAAVWTKAGAGADNATTDALLVSVDPVTLAAIMNIIGITVTAPANAAISKVQMYDWRITQRF